MERYFLREGLTSELRFII